MQVALEPSNFVLYIDKCTEEKECKLLAPHFQSFQMMYRLVQNSLETFEKTGKSFAVIDMMHCIAYLLVGVVLGWKPGNYSSKFQKILPIL